MVRTIDATDFQKVTCYNLLHKNTVCSYGIYFSAYLLLGISLVTNFDMFAYACIKHVGLFLFAFLSYTVKCIEFLSIKSLISS